MPCTESIDHWAEHCDRLRILDMIAEERTELQCPLETQTMQSI